MASIISKRYYRGSAVMKRENEINALKALVEIMPFLTGARYKHDRSPDEEGSQTPEVDYLLKPNSSQVPAIAVEHTIVEAFRGQKTYVDRSYDIVEDVNVGCKDRLPPDRYFVLVVPHLLVESLRKQAIRKFIDAVTPWIVATSPVLSFDEHRTMLYSGQEVLLMCSGSHPEINGTLHTIPCRPKNQEDLAWQSLWLSISHGLGKFSKYKRLHYDTVLALEDISGEVHPSMLLEIERTDEKQTLISNLVDYIIVFASHENRMIVANVWKEKHSRYSPVPFNRRFENTEGKWTPLGMRSQ